MPYTFWHAGILIGSSEMDQKFRNPGQRGGVFVPTPYGLAIFPRLTGILSAGHAMKRHLDAQGRSPESMERDEMLDELEASPAGRKILDIGRMLSEVEVRGPDGSTRPFASIGFTDLLEMRELARELHPESPDDLPPLPPDAPRYLVSATFRRAWPSRHRHAPAPRSRSFEN